MSLTKFNSDKIVKTFSIHQEIYNVLDTITICTCTIYCNFIFLGNFRKPNEGIMFLSHTYNCITVIIKFCPPASSTPFYLIDQSFLKSTVFVYSLHMQGNQNSYSCSVKSLIVFKSISLLVVQLISFGSYVYIFSIMQYFHILVILR